MKNLGDEVKDTITGFKGIVVARTEWLNGCARVTVQPQSKAMERRSNRKPSTSSNLWC